MMIGAILTGITYTSYQIISKSYRSFNTRQAELAQVERLDELLKKDFNRAEVIEKDDRGILVKSKRDTIRYEFTPDYILRVSSITDTFKLRNEDITASFEDQPVDGKGAGGEDNRLDRLTFSLLFQNESAGYQYHKVYSSANLFDRNPYALR